MPYTHPTFLLWIGTWRCSWQSGSQVPPSFEATWMLSCHKVTLGNLIQCVGKKTTTLFSCTFKGCAMLTDTSLGHKLRADSGRRLPPPVWLHSLQKSLGVSWETHIHPTKCAGKTEWGRSLGKLSTCRNWSIWHTVGRNISETCSLQMNQRKMQNKTTQQRQGWDLFFNSVYNAEISSSSRSLISHWIAYRNSYSYPIVYKVQSRQSRRRVGFENALESYKAELPLFWRGRCPWATQVFCEDPVLSDFCREIRKLHERLGLVFPSPSIPIKGLIHYSLNKSCPCNVSHSLLEDHQNSVQAGRTLKKAK